MVQENLTGVRVVRAFGREMYEIDKFNEKNDGFSSLWIKLGRVLSLFWASGTLLTSAQVFVTIVAGVVEAVNGDLTLGSFLVFVSYSSSLAWPIRSLGRVLAEMSKAGVSIDRVGYILNSEPEGATGQELTPAHDGRHRIQARRLRLRGLRGAARRELHHPRRLHLRHPRRHRQREEHPRPPA